MLYIRSTFLMRYIRSICMLIKWSLFNRESFYLIFFCYHFGVEAFTSTYPIYCALKTSEYITCGVGEVFKVNEKSNNLAKQNAYYIVTSNGVKHFRGCVGKTIRTYLLHVSHICNLRPRVARAQLYRLSLVDAQNQLPRTSTREKKLTIFTFFSWHCAMYKSVNCHTMSWS